jgi:excisionase family DNA binding protein
VDTPEFDAPYDPTLVLLTVEEAARRLRIGRTLCFRLIGSGDLESIRIGGLRRVPAEAVHAYVTQLRTAGQPTPAAA